MINGHVSKVKRVNSDWIITASKLKKKRGFDASRDFHAPSENADCLIKLNDVSWEIV